MPNAQCPMSNGEKTRRLVIGHWSLVIGQFMNITVLCFAASYIVSLTLEVSRVFFRSAVRGFVMVGFAIAGLIAHTWYLTDRAAHATGSPLSSPFDWLLVAAWFLTLTYLYFAYYYRREAIGVFILPVVLALIGAAQFASREPFATSPASSVWGMIHGVLLVLGTVALLVGFVSGLMYLIHARRLKQKLPPMRGFRLLSLERLDAINNRSIVLSCIFLALGVVSGVVLNLVLAHRDLSQIPWNDPLVYSSSILLGWVFLATAFNALYKPARHGRKVAYLTLASFVFLAIVLGVLVLSDSQHGGKTSTSTTRKRVSQPEIGSLACASCLYFSRRAVIELPTNVLQSISAGGRR
jgi:ABC-type transport system involved in cytochrome c biogenesis permease subunit